MGTKGRVYWQSAEATDRVEEEKMREEARKLALVEVERKRRLQAEENERLRKEEKVKTEQEIWLKAAEIALLKKTQKMPYNRYHRTKEEMAESFVFALQSMAKNRQMERNIRRKWREKMEREEQERRERAEEEEQLAGLDDKGREEYFKEKERKRVEAEEKKKKMLMKYVKEVNVRRKKEEVQWIEGAINGLLREVAGVAVHKGMGKAAVAMEFISATQSMAARRRA